MLPVIYVDVDARVQRARACRYARGAMPRCRVVAHAITRKRRKQRAAFVAIRVIMPFMLRY